ncbi:MAG: hypothetical protein AAGG75_09610 [Bacteroidota bacterium]
MRSYLTSLLVLTLLLLGCYACKQNAELQPADYSLENVDQCLTAFNRGKSKKKRATFIHGEVFVRAASEDRLVAYVLEEKQATPLIYILEMSNLDNKNFQLQIANAEILFLRRALLLNAKDKPMRVLLGLADFGAEAQEFIDQISFNYQFEGFGLGEFKGYAFPNNGDGLSARTFGIPGGPPIDEKPDCSCRYASTEYLDSCDAGGPGSSSCSVSAGGRSCSTTCQDADTYSCCRYGD